MASLPGRAVRLVARLVALAWLLVLSPLELAMALASLVSRTVAPGPAGVVLAAARIAVVATGLVLGRQLLQRHSVARKLALAWAAADLGTLALVLASSALPSNRAPGDGPLVWLAYAVAATTVVAAARERPD